MSEYSRCASCPYYGVIDVDKNENLVWSCTRISCVEQIETNMGFMSLDDYLEIKAQQHGFETYQDLLESSYKIRF